MTKFKLNVIKEIFYDIFWNHKACRNLFLLSKDELLDTKEIKYQDNLVKVTFPRIILSNIKKDDFDTTQISIRNKRQSDTTQRLLEKHIEAYTPLISNYLEGKFGKPLTKVTTEIEKGPLKFIFRVLKVFLVADEKKKEEEMFNLAHSFGFVPKNIKNFDELKNYFKREAIDKNFKEVLSEENLHNFLEFIKSIKDIYVNEYYKSLYNSNQVLLNSFEFVENFESRLKLFDILYDCKIIVPGNEESIIECNKCEDGVYKGIIHIKIKPSKTEALVCPICKDKLTYFIPYSLNHEIYNTIKGQDGLILDALKNLLSKIKIEYNTNSNVLSDIEIDCSFEKNNILCIVETKMYRSLETRKLKEKINTHYNKLNKDITRIKNELYPNKKVIGILLTNINDDDKLNELINECSNSENVLIMNIDSIKKYLN